MTILMALPCAAQSDGGGKKKKKITKTEQTTSNNTKRKQEEAQRRQEVEAEPQQEEARRQQEAEARRRHEEFEKYKGHKYVDLGLPSGIKWATCNVGAISPGDYGNYYAWGEIKPKTNYDWSNYFDCLDRGDSWGIYKLEGKTQISPTSGHDPARENWGGTWRMPTASEFEELNDKCTWEWSVRDGHDGYLVIGPNGKSIFLPAAGCRDGTSFGNIGVFGYYCSSSLSTSESRESRYLYFWDGKHGMSRFYRKLGYSVRPVTE